jgi:hypothetical protein
MGISRKAHRSVAFGTAQFGGLGLEHLAAYQGHSCLQYLMGHLRCNITTGKLMHSMLDYTHVKLLPLPQPPMRSRTDARTNPSAQRATQLRSVLARVYAVSIQNQITTTVP